MFLLLARGLLGAVTGLVSGLEKLKTMTDVAAGLKREEYPHPWHLDLYCTTEEFRRVTANEDLRKAFNAALFHKDTAAVPVCSGCGSLRVD